jgi:hypothetical protein
MRHKGLLCAAAAMLALPALTSASAQTVYETTGVQYVEYPGYYTYDRYYRGPGVLDIPGRVVADTVATVDGVLGGPYRYYGPYAGTGVVYAESGVAACARRFRSFDPVTGTYTTYEGEQVVCPYLAD